jgi:Peptidase family M28
MSTVSSQRHGPWSDAKLNPMRSHLVCVFLLIAPAAWAQGPWLGVKLPAAAEPRFQREWAAYREPDFPVLSLRHAAGDDLHAGIRGTDVHRHLADIVAITEANRPVGEKFWGRLAGSKAERATARYLRDQFTAAGLRDVRLEKVTGGTQWWPVDWRATLLADPAFGAGTEDLVLGSAFPALQLGEGALQLERLEGELVYVGLGQPVDLVGKDLQGKIAVVRSVLQADPFFQSARGHIGDILKAGASAVLIAMDAPGNAQYAVENMGSATAPCFMLGGEDGRFLQSVIAAAAPAPVKLRITMKSELRTSWEGDNVIAELPGKSDETILVIAHLDGYFQGANDNAGGLAAMAALAKYFAGPQAPRLKRRHLFIGTSAHHEFSDGVRHFIERHPEVIAKTQLVFNIEHPASTFSYYRGPLRLPAATVPGQLTVTTGQGSRSVTISNGNPQLVSIYRDAIDRHGLVVDAMFDRRPTGDAFDFYRAGLPVVQIIDANFWFHSTEDRVETISPSGLERATRLYADVLVGIDGASSTALGLGRRQPASPSTRPAD